MGAALLHAVVQRITPRLASRPALNASHQPRAPHRAVPDRELPFIDRVVRAFSLTAAPGLLRTGSGPLLPIYEALPQINVPLEALTGVSGLPVCGSVSTIAFSLAEKLGCSPIVLVGQDLAYTTGRTHAGGTWWEASRASISETTGEVRLQWSEELKKVGHRHDHEPLAEVAQWGGAGTVFSGASFTGIRAWFEAAAELLGTARPGLALINSTEGGARLRGFDERPLAEVLSALPARGITAEAIAARARELAAPLSRSDIAAWLRAQSESSAAARRAARRVRKLGNHALGAIRADDPISVTRAFEALDKKERTLRDAVRNSPFLDAWCHAAIERVMSGHQPEQGARAAALSATARGIGVATIIEEQARELSNELARAAERNSSSG
jgi:hypothetical protein